MLKRISSSIKLRARINIAALSSSRHAILPCGLIDSWFFLRDKYFKQKFRIYKANTNFCNWNQKNIQIYRKQIDNLRIQTISITNMWKIEKCIIVNNILVFALHFLYKIYSGFLEGFCYWTIYVIPVFINFQLANFGVDPKVKQKWKWKWKKSSRIFCWHRYRWITGQLTVGYIALINRTLRIMSIFLISS